MDSEAYLHSLLPPVSKEIKELEDYAKENKVPIMDPLGMNFLMQLIRIHKPRRILEIGTAIGYSALRMLEAQPSTEIVTLERDTDRFKVAEKNVQFFGKQEKITIIHGDALEVKEQVMNYGYYDLIFIDAAKGKYAEFFQFYAPLLTSEGMIISDNVLFKGAVANPEDSSGRVQKIAAKVRRFNETLTGNSDYHTTIVPVGDGVAITVKA
ncbi:O-methyltransferase [Halobacillus sp. A5]|uniref:O-methyltransferase n=1 Tax=Halobacillus sp. A5 TaxID=2880263 RepID=UPI0020A6B07F|nr:O-methyltransferase [Halobacillus sp. A5]MCP3025592.1 O-methyltransferase [Halobacillus sp. A5]